MGSPSGRSPGRPAGKPAAPPNKSADLGATTAPVGSGDDLGATTAPAKADLGATTAPADAAGLGETTAPEAGAGLGETTAPPGQAKRAAPSTQSTQAFQETQSAGTPAAGPKTQRGGAKLTALGDFKLVKKLGAGGMGEVYKAHQVSLDRDAAVKVMAKHLASNANFVERFYREARVMAKLDHPYIIRSYGVGQEQGFHYLAMEFVDGGSLQDCLKRLGKLSVPDSLLVLIACARALEHAHGMGVIHRDIKPDNVMLTSKGVVKLADLGLAKATEEDVALTQSGVGAGTPLYMAPEQAANAKYADARSDIYALGGMLYCLLTGNPPFQGETALELIKAKELGKFPPARKANKDVPERLDLMLDKMLARQPEQRYQTCTDMIKDLEGLGLASQTLSFFGDKAKAAATVVPGTSPRPPASGVSAGPKTPPAPDIWWVSYTDEQSGKQVIKQLSEAQVRKLVATPNFDVEAQARRNKHEQWRSLASYKEFAQALRARLTQVKATAKTGRLNTLYDEIDKDERKKARWAKIKKMFADMKAGASIVIVLALLAGVLVGGFLAFRHFTK